jgi:hypothetical protein
MNNRQ